MYWGNISNSLLFKKTYFIFQTVPSESIIKYLKNEGIKLYYDNKNFKSRYYLGRIGNKVLKKLKLYYLILKLKLQKNV